jgi:protocatechuate 3,4-dioxygenase beta subunit
VRTIAFGVLTAALTIPQTAPQPSPNTDLLTGRVVTLGGNDLRPVRRAQVTLKGASGTRVTDTDTSGVYRFDRLPRGSYKVSVRKAGFVTLETAAAADATLTLERGGAIEGSVFDSMGDPIWNVAVSALLVRSGERPTAVAQVRTDDLGRYRLHSLQAGDYYVEVETDDTYRRGLFIAGGNRSFDRTLHPSAAALEDARPVHVSLGLETTSVNVVMKSAPSNATIAFQPVERGTAAGASRISGRVVDGGSGKPIPGARLMLVTADALRSGAIVLADAQGQFAFRSLEPRRYLLAANAERFVGLEFGQKAPGDTGHQIDVRAGDDLTADFMLPRASAIEGTVVDEFGDPAPSISIRIARRQYAAGRHRLTAVGSTLQWVATDDRGHFRIGALEPGDYFVVALSGAYTDTNEGGVFAPTYCPGTDDAHAAAAVTLALGADSTAPFSLVPATTVRVSGKMVDPDGRPVAGGTIWLLPPDRLRESNLDVIRSTTAADGTFVLPQVPKGVYTIQGLGPPIQSSAGARPFGWLPVTVGEQHLDSVVLEVTRGKSLRGHVVLEDTSTPPPNVHVIAVTTVPVEFDSSPIGQMRLTSSTPVDFGSTVFGDLPTPSVTRDDLSFEVSRLSGLRRILVTVGSPNWTVKRITRNGIDITDTPQDFRSTNVEDVEVVLTPKITRLTGGVSDAKGPIGDCAVVAFSTDPTKWVDRSRFVMLTRSTLQGRFELRGLPPEEYLAIALPRIVQSEWEDPDFLQQLRAEATTFTLGEGDSRVLDLKLKKRP